MQYSIFNKSTINIQVGLEV